MLDRETTMQVGASVGAVLLFVAIAVVASQTYGSNGHVTETGGYVLVGAVAVFILVIGVAGLWLSQKEFEDAAEAAEAAEAADAEN